MGGKRALEGGGRGVQLTVRVHSHLIHRPRNLRFIHQTIARLNRELAQRLEVRVVDELGRATDGVARDGGCGCGRVVRLGGEGAVTELAGNLRQG